MKKLVLCTGICAVLGGAAQAASIDFTNVLINQLTETQPGTAFPNPSDVTVDANDGGGETQALVDFLDFDLPDGAIVTSATMTFYTNSSTSGTVSAHQLLTPFDATSTWNSFGGGVTLGTQAETAPASQLVSPGDEQFHTFDVTQLVRDWQAGDAVNGVAFFNDSSDGWDFDGDDTGSGGTGPILSVDYVMGDLVSLTGAQTNQLDEANPDTAFPNLPDVVVDLDNGGFETQALVTFDGLDNLPSDRALEIATLEFYTNSTTDGLVAVFQLLSEFDENTTWNSFGNGVTPGADTTLFPADVLFAPEDEQRAIFDVTAIVQAWLDGDAPLGFALLIDSIDGWDFDGDASGAGGFGPTLNLVFAAEVPLPASALLLLGGMAGLVVCRRQKDRD
ncbi:MAG: DNRLRE domain-containing protein [Pseudomonadota bacterium]